MEWKFGEGKVFIDGRMTGWKKKDGGYFLSDYVKILRGECETARKYPIKTVLLEKNTKNKCFEEFKILYEDSISKVMVKSL